MLVNYGRYFQSTILFITFYEKFDFKSYMKILHENKKVMFTFFCMNSSLVIILLHDTAQPHVARMTMLKHKFPGWHCKSSLSWDIRLCHIHHNLLIFHPLTTNFTNIWTLFNAKKHSILKGEIEIAFKNFLASKPLEFYHTSINNLVNQRQKFIDVQGLYFHWLYTLFQFIYSGMKIYYKFKTLFSKKTNIYIYIYIYIFPNLISTSIHGYQKKRKKKRQEQEIKYLKSLPRGKKKKYYRTKRKKRPTPSHHLKKPRDMQSVGQKKTKTLRQHCNATNYKSAQHEWSQL